MATTLGKDPAPALLRLQACSPIDCTSIVPAPTATLTRALYATCICYHPTKPIIAVGASGYAAVFDVLSGSRIGRLDLKMTPAEMAFTPDGSMLVIAAQEWVIVGITLSGWRTRVLVPRRSKADKPLESCLLAVAAGPRPVVYFCKYGKEMLRMCYVDKPVTLDARGKVVREREGWGTRLKMDVVKPILGLACHPTDQQVLLLHADGVLRVYAPAGGGEQLALLHAVPACDPAPKALPALGTLEVVPHPSVPGGALVLQASRLGQVHILEVLGRSAPTTVLRTRMQGWAAILGMGLHQDSHLLLIFGLTESGKVRCGCWRMLTKHMRPGVLLQPMKVEPADMTPLMDTLSVAKVAQHAAEAGPAAGPNHNSAAGYSPLQYAAARAGASHGGAAGLAAVGQPAVVGGAAGNGSSSSSSSWQALWNPVCPWTYDMSSSVLLDAPLAPLVSRVCVHRLLGSVACQLEPSFSVQTTPALLQQPLGQLTLEELNIAKRTASVPQLALVNTEQHFSGWQGGLAAPLHTPLATWQPDPGAGGSFRFQLPCHLYHLSDGKLAKYGLATRAASPLVQLPSEGPGGTQRVARHLSFSRHQCTWLVLFESVGAEPAENPWQWTLLHGTAFESSAPPVWLKPGKYATFIGPDDAYVAVVEPSGKVAALFDTKATDSAGAAPLFTVNLEGAAGPGGAALPLLPGPPCHSVPQAGAKWEGAKKARTRGSGVLLWQTQEGQLVMGSMPAMYQETMASNSDSDDEGQGGGHQPPQQREKAQVQRPTGLHLGQQGYSASLALLPGEQVLCCAWQSLLPSTPVAPCDCMGALLTNSRIILVTGDLQPHAVLDISSNSPAAAAHPVTSILWVGPVLLYCTVAGQIMALTWQGATHPVCHVAPSHRLLLAGASTDSLLLLRPAGRDGSAMEVVTRPVSMLQPLLAGWVALGTSGLLPLGSSVARGAMQGLLELYDCSGATPALLWALMGAGCPDVAAALSQHVKHLDPASRMAAAASAGHWPQVVAALRLERDRALAHPPGSPPARGSQLHLKCVAAAAGALAHGQVGHALELLKMAGEWRAAMVVAVCQGNTTALHEVSQAVARGGAPAKEAAEATQLATALSGLYSRAGALTPDYQLQLLGPNGETIPDASAWELAQPSTIPQAEAVAGTTPAQIIGPGEVGAMPPLDPAQLAPYLALPAAATSGLISAAAAAGPGARAQRDSSIRIQVPPGVAAAMEDGEASPSDAQAAARADFLAMGSVAGSSDDDDDLESRSELSGAGAASRRFKIQIRGKDEGPAVGSGAVDSNALKEAAKKLTLVPPAPGAMGAARSSRFASAASTDGVGGPSPSASSLSPALLAGLAGPPPGLTIPPPPASAAAPGSVASPSSQLARSPSSSQGGTLQFPPGVSSVALYQQGVALMEQADWKGASATFSRAISVLNMEENKGPQHQQRVSFCAQYYAAVRLLMAAGAGAGPKEARLYRFASALKLDDRHQLALVREAVQRNKAVGNYRYCADQLTWLITKMLGAAPEEYMAQLQADIEECDRAGGRNRDIPADENVEDFVAIVAASSSKEDVDTVILPML